MAEHSLGALYKALNTQLLSNSLEIWETRVHADREPATIKRPYALFRFSGGGDLHKTRKPHAQYLVDVKCVAESLDTAMTAAARIIELLSDRGVQDNPIFPQNAPVLNGGSSWVILTSTRDIDIHLLEDIESGARVLYHEGARFKIRMERI